MGRPGAEGLRARQAQTSARTPRRWTCAKPRNWREYEIPVFFNKPPHQPHLENFFNAIRGTAKLNCPGDEAFTSEYVIHKANEAMGAEKKLSITSEEVESLRS